ncbi:MAG TPA: SusC/RagA family TonB-linked outer membrane protein [Gemmatimonadaceae bacterium]|nr:SusC/RagA family TonB-linked outer membrane protein [Gemmatimonadaceae bacterium]
MSPHRSLRIICTLCASLLAAAVARPVAAQRQTGTITGTVTNARTQQPLSAVSVYLDGTRLGTITGDDGKYSILNVPAGTYTLRARRIGFGSVSNSITVQAGQTVTHAIALGEAAIQLEQVVVTGTAAATQKREVPNSISVLSSAQIANAPVRNPQDALEGSVPSVTIMENSGQPGAGGTVMIRGTNTISQSTYPLIYVDGVRVFNQPTRNGYGSRTETNPLQNINANDIDHIEVIKGASATTLYGTEASGGVIQIFTKHGQSGAPTWNADITEGLNQSVHWGDQNDPTNLWVNCDNSKLMYTLDLSDGSRKYFADPTCPSDGSWTRHGPIQKYALSVRGGSNQVTYYVSGNYNDNKGILPTTNARNGGVRGNFTFSATDKLNFNLNTAYTKLDNRFVGDGNNSEGFLLDVGRGTGTYLKGGKGHDCDGVADSVVCVTNGYVFDQNETTGSDHYLIGFTTNYDPTLNFTNRLAVGWDYTAIHNITNLPYGFLDTPGGYFWDENTRHTKLSLDYAGSLKNSVGASLASTLSWGGQLFRDKHRWTEIDVQDFAGPVDPTLVTGAQLTYRNDIPFAETNAGFFFQEELAWKERLYLTGGLRVDGNSAFGSNFGLQLYPKLGLSYVLSDYGFWPKSWWDNMRVRIAVGESGKAPGAFDKLRSWQARTANEGDPAVVPDQIGNPDIGPERTREIEGGFDASFVSGRLGLETTVYQATTYDALVPVTYPPSNGFLSSRLENIGKLQNRGLEMQITAGLIRTHSIDWTARVNLSMMKSKALDLGTQKEVYTGLNSDIKQGDPFPDYYGKVILNPNAIADPQVVDDTLIGNVNPNRLYGFGTTLTLWNNLSLDALLEHQGGFYVQNYTGYQNARRGDWHPCFDTQLKMIAAANGNTSALNDVTALQRARCSADDYDISFWTEKGDFTKLRYVSLTYTLPGHLASNFFGARAASITLAARNLRMWTDYTGSDPEVEDFTDQSNLVGTAARFGRRDYYEIPAPRTYTIAFHVTF